MKLLLLSTFVVFIPGILTAQNQPSYGTTGDHVAFQRVVIDENPPHDPWIKIIGDINGDGWPDVIVGGQNGPLVWYANPTWDKQVITNGGYSTVQGAVGDIDGDGDLDVVLGGVFWYENPGSGNQSSDGLWKTHRIDDLRVHDILVADLDSDGKPDIVGRDQSEFGYHAGNKVILYKQNTPDNWSRVDIACPHGAGVLLADIDHDGDQDVVIGGRWYENPGRIVGAEWKERFISPKWDYGDTKIVAADFNGDGRLDVAICPSELQGGSYKIAWYEAPANPRSSGDWTEHLVESPVETVVHAFNASDIDGDGLPDLVAASMHQGADPREVRIYFNQQSGRNWHKQVISTRGSHETWTVDLDGDGATDIIGANWSGPYQPVEWWKNTKKIPLDKWTYIQVDSTRNNRYFGLSAFDVNKDGFPDIISGRYFYRNPGGDMTGNWERIDLGLNADAMLFIDVDGDKFADCIAEAFPDVYWLEAEDTEGKSWNAHKIASLPATQHGNGQGFKVAQIIPGGRAEIVLSTGKGIYYLEIPDHPSDGNWPAIQIAPEATEQGLAVGDIDGDGLCDITASYGPEVESKMIAWWKNSGDKTGKWKLNHVGQTENYGADRLALADVNGDGRADIVVSEESWQTQDTVAQLFIFRQEGKGTTPLWKRESILTSGSLNSLDVADMNHDGDLDIVTGEHKGKEKRVFVLENVGKGDFLTHVIDHNNKESHLGTLLFDMDRDGDLDILSIAWDEYRYLHLWRNDAIVH